MRAPSPLSMFFADETEEKEAKVTPTTDSDEEMTTNIIPQKFESKASPAKKQEGGGGFKVDSFTL
jgi:hypothetical protein